MVSSDGCLFCVAVDNIMIRNDGSIKLVDFGNSDLPCADDLESVLFTFVHLIALSKPWREYYKGNTLLRKLVSCYLQLVNDLLVLRIYLQRVYAYFHSCMCVCILLCVLCSHVFARIYLCA